MTDVIIADSWYVQGTMSDEMAQGWIRAIDGWACAPWAASIWAEKHESYMPDFALKLDSVFEAGARC